MVLCGVSAGMNCWFEGSTTDSFDLTQLREVVTTEACSTAYRVAADGEEALDARLL